MALSGFGLGRRLGWGCGNGCHRGAGIIRGKNLTLSNRDRDCFLKAIEQPPALNEKLKEAFDK